MSGHVMSNGRPCALSDGHNGKHRSPAALERRREQQRESYRVRYDSEPEFAKKERARVSDYYYERMPFKVRAMRQMRARRRKALQRIEARNERYGAPDQADLDFIEQSFKEMYGLPTGGHVFHGVPK